VATLCGATLVPGNHDTANVFGKNSSATATGVSNTTVRAFGNNVHKP
jgi:hypothetical protein